MLGSFLSVLWCLCYNNQNSVFDSHEELYSARPYGALDSGFNSVDSGDKRWSGNEVSVAALFVGCSLAQETELISIYL